MTGMNGSALNGRFAADRQHDDVPAAESVVIVGASLAGLSAAETLREEGFAGRITLVGAEVHPPYDRPPLSKWVLTGRSAAEDAGLPARVALDASWRLGKAAAALDRQARLVTLADGEQLGYDKLLIATGARARPWPNSAERALDGVLTIRTLDDARELRGRLAERPRRVLVIGAGFIGSEVASVCRELGLDVTVVERGPAPLSRALGAPVAAVAGRIQREHGVDLRTCTSVVSLKGDEAGRLRMAELSDGDSLEVDVAVVALGAERNVEWLDGSGLMLDARGVRCDSFCHAVDATGRRDADVFVAGDVACRPHPLFVDDLLAVEHWDNAMRQARTAARGMLYGPTTPYTALPTFWSNQFGVNIKVVGVPGYADQFAVVQGSENSASFLGAYGRDGRIVAAVAVDMPRALDAYAVLIQDESAFPPELNAPDAPAHIDVLDLERATSV